MAWLQTALVVAVWYFVNIALLVLNKVLLTGSSRVSACVLTFAHMVACLACGVIASASGLSPPLSGRIRSRAQFLKIGALSSIFCGTIVLSNASLKYIPVSFNQAIGATTPFFTAVLAVLLQDSRETLLTYATLVPIVGGIAIACGGEPLFHALGFGLALVATAGRALKSVVQSMLMTDPSEKLDPMSLLTYMSMFCCALLLPASIYLEPQGLGILMTRLVSDQRFMLWLLSNSLLAYFVNLFNFLVTKLTGPLTLQVLGNAKGVAAAAVSVAVFGNPVTSTGMLGYGMTVTGVVLYSEVKRRSKAAAALTTQSRQQDVETAVARREMAAVEADSKNHHMFQQPQGRSKLHFLNHGNYSIAYSSCGVGVVAQQQQAGLSAAAGLQPIWHEIEPVPSGPPPRAPVSGGHATVEVVVRSPSKQAAWERVLPASMPATRA